MYRVKFISNNLLLLVLLASGLGFFFPQALLPVRPYTELLFSITMFSIGMVLHFKDLGNILAHPREIFLGTAAQYTIMPLGAFFIARIFHLSAPLAVGLILTGSAPGAMTSNVISYLAKADVAYSISLTTLATLISPIMTPLLTLILAGRIIEVSFLAMFWSIVKMIVLPLFLGFIIKHYLWQKPGSFIEIFPAISVVAIALICGLVVALNKEMLLGLSAQLFSIVFLLNLAGMLLAYIWSSSLKFGRQRIKTLMIEISMQNAGLGVVLALKHFSLAAALPSAVFTIWCIISASMMVRFWKLIKY